jgi:hypothetical protein
MAPSVCRVVDPRRAWSVTRRGRRSRFAHPSTGCLSRPGHPGRGDPLVGARLVALGLSLLAPPALRLGGCSRDREALLARRSPRAAALIWPDALTGSTSHRQPRSSPPCWRCGDRPRDAGCSAVPPGAAIWSGGRAPADPARRVRDPVPPPDWPGCQRSSSGPLSTAGWWWLVVWLSTGQAFPSMRCRSSRRVTPTSPSGGPLDCAPARSGDRGWGLSLARPARHRRACRSRRSAWLLRRCTQQPRAQRAQLRWSAVPSAVAVGAGVAC